ncbi:hypothetical protein [Hoeflea sp.]|uniref:hypothetical protein n=1 Tax=Hoeflea sp. TaxID=1940281 RepID=UPI003B52C287
MCDDLTRQEILFFAVMQAHPLGISEDDLFEGMSQLALELGWPSYLNAVPRSLSERLVEARDRGMIAKYQPLRWRPASNVAAYVRHLVDHYLEDFEQKEKILSRLESKLQSV